MGDDRTPGDFLDEAINGIREESDRADAEQAAAIAEQNERIEAMRERVHSLESELAEFRDGLDDSPVPPAGWEVPTIGGSFFDVSAAVPRRARMARAAHPERYEDAFDVVDVSDYAGGRDDLAHGITAASDEGAIAKLTTGEYRIKDRTTAPGDVWGMYAPEGEEVVLHLDSFPQYAFEPNAKRGVISNVEWNIEGIAGQPCGYLFGGNFTERFWSRNVSLVGEKYGGENHSYTWRPHMTRKDAIAHVYGLTMKDGDHMPSDVGKAPTGGQRSQGVTTDPGHIGYICYEAGDVRNFLGNGWYISFNPYQRSTPNFSGTADLIGCKAVNNNRGNFRIGMNDRIVGGYVEVNGVREPTKGQCLVIDYATAGPNDPSKVVGLGIRSGEYNRDAIVARNFWYTKENPAWIHLEKILLDTWGVSPAIRYTSGNSASHDHVEEHAQSVNVRMKDCFVYDHGDEAGNERPAITLDRNADVEVEGMFAYSGENPLVEVNGNAHGLTWEGEDYGEGTYTIEDLGGAPDPRLVEGERLPNMRWAWG